MAGRQHVFPPPPPPPQNAFYPDLHPLNYPPKPSLEAYRVITQDGTHAISIKWTITREPTRGIAGFEFLLYEYRGGPYLLYMWRTYRGEILHVHLSGLLIPISQLTPNRRYFFTVRFVDNFNKFGNFSNPISIDV